MVGLFINKANITYFLVALGATKEKVFIGFMSSVLSMPEEKVKVNFIDN